MQTLLEITISNALVACLLALLAFIVARWRQPALAHGLWILVLVKLVTPPILPIYLPSIPLEYARNAEVSPPKPPMRVEDRTITADELVTLLALAQLSVESSKAEVEPIPPIGEKTSSPPVSPSWQQCVIPLWLGGTAICLGWTLWSVCRFRWLLRSARLAPRHIQNQTRELAYRLGLQSCPQVWLVPGTVSPMIWAIGAAPRLLFPTGLLDRLDAEQRAALLLHELAHVRRRDHWVRFVELLVSAFYWWNPVVWLARRELREAEEECCDAWVVWASSGEGTAYARALLETVAFVSRTRFPLPVSASGIGHVFHLRRRLTMIMQANTPKSLSAAGWLLLGLAAFALPFAAKAQTPGDDEKREVDVKALKKSAEDVQEIEVAEDVVVDLVAEMDEDDEQEQKQEEIAGLKKEIAETKAELQKLEAKLKALVAGSDAKKGAKIKVDGKKELRLEGVQLEKALKDKKVLIELATDKAMKEQAKAMEQAKKALQEAQSQLQKQGIKIDLNVDDLIKKAIDGKLKEKIKINPKDGKPIELDIRLDNLKIEPQLKDIIIKNFDGQLKNLEELKRFKAVDMKLLEDAKAGIKLELDKNLKDLKVITEQQQDKGQNIELRLEKLMKELQELKNEMKASKKPQVK